MDNSFPHIFLNEAYDIQAYHPKGLGEFLAPERNREAHYQALHSQLQSASMTAATAWKTSTEREGITPDGIYLDFSGSVGFPLNFESIENRKSGIRLRNFRSIGHGKNQVQSATLFFPRSALPKFRRKLDAYHDKTTRKGRPQNADCVDSIDQIHIGTLASIWTDSISLLPQGNQAEWCELWLDTQNTVPAEASAAFRAQARMIGIELDANELVFPERVVILGHATQVHLRRLVSTCSAVAEIRRAKESAHFFLETAPRHQTEWVEHLASRLVLRRGSDVSVCVLDTGANNGHRLLQPLLATPDCHAAKPAWSPNDTDKFGHGTGMCGLAAYGDLAAQALASEPIEIDYRLESVKILEAADPATPPHYGRITIDGISRAKKQSPQRKRILCMAVTATDARDNGKPSSWSGAIDALLSGADGDGQRLMFIAAGNVEKAEAADYPRSNLLPEHGVHDPGQSWNSVTVGAYTVRDHISDPAFPGYTPLAGNGELSPSSTTSDSWNTDWPAKPDIVLEGGNYARGPDGAIDTPDDFLLLTTGHQPLLHQFGCMNATSAATALAAKMAASIQVRYPEAWPETIRGLMIHSAEWTDALKGQFLSILGKNEFQKRDYARLLRFCGYGVPDQNRAMDCAKNVMTLISQAEITPFEKPGSSPRAKDIHFYTLPWPKAALLNLGETPVTLRVTLSYFIEPAPGSTGRGNRYQYASHLLRFDLNKENEDESDFRRRINHETQDEDGIGVGSATSSPDWLLGPVARNKGSIHSDRIESTAASLATRNLVAVYPKTGWWKTRPYLDKWWKTARYSLIVSLTTPAQDIDIYTPVAIQVGTLVPVQIP